MLIVTRRFGAPIKPEQPGKGAPYKGRATCRRQHAMGDHHPLDRPREHARECRARCPSVDETQTPVARGAGMGSDNPVKPDRDAAPPFEPVAREILDQIGEQSRAAVTVEKHDLGERTASVQDDLVNIASPCGLGRIAKLGIERKIPAFAS
jgi:hypothetical protein